MPGTSMARNDIDDSDDEREQQHASKRRKIQVSQTFLLPIKARTIKSNDLSL